MLPTLSSILRWPSSSRLSAGLLVFAGAMAFGACSAVLDFTECREDIDCAGFFTDDQKPMQCDNQQCVAGSGCTTNSQCSGLGDDYICNLSGSCAATTSEQCDAPIYPGDKASDKVIFIGSIVARSGDDKDLGATAEKAFKSALDDFHAGGGTVKVGGEAQMVAIVPCDSSNSTVQATAAAKHLGTGLTVPAILGPLDDDELITIAKSVSITNGVFAYTHSPIATADIDFDDKSLVWLTNVQAEVQGRAFGSHLQHEIDSGDVFDSGDPKATLLFAQDAYGYSMYYALATQAEPGKPNRIPEINSQVISSYNNLDTGKLRIDSFGDTDILIILGGADVAELLVHFKSSGKPWPRRVYVSQRSFAAVKALGDTSLIDSLRAIGPDLETANLAALRKRLGGSEPAEFGLAYDAAMVTLLAMSSHTGSEPITGVSIRAAMSRLSDPAGTKVSFGDAPATFVKAAVAALQAGKNVDLEGASGPLDYRKDGSICGGMMAFGLDATGKSFVPVERFTPDCSASPLNGTWSAVP
jgi:ABC-type branched-subunit amino acid transport system substrate-binding protein